MRISASPFVADRGRFRTFGREIRNLNIPPAAKSRNLPSRRESGNYVRKFCSRLLTMSEDAAEISLKI
jgi:hypothetical protein